MRSYSDDLVETTKDVRIRTILILVAINTVISVTLVGYELISAMVTKNTCNPASYPNTL